MKKFGIKEVVATGIGTALFIVLTEVQIPLGIIPNTSMQPRAAVLAFLAAVFGPVVGGIIGLLGHALGDALFYGGVWWSWVFPDAIFGILVGLFAKRFEIKAGGFNKKKVVLFNVVLPVSKTAARLLRKNPASHGICSAAGLHMPALYNRHPADSRSPIPMQKIRRHPPPAPDGFP